MCTFVLMASNIYKSYYRKKVLNGIELELEPGGIYGIVGENGCGKSTLMNILTGFIKADKGKVNIAGNYGYCPQNTLVFKNLTVWENMRYFGIAYGMKNEDITRSAQKLAARFNFENYMNIRASNLSSGTLQKLNLVIALLHAPDILFLDEPYAALDWETYLIFWKFAGELKKAGKTIIIVSHLLYDRDKTDVIQEIINGKLKEVNQEY